MLLRLQVQGFKNLHHVDVRFGPLTCLVGPNGVGKSNLFDAIRFLRHLADHDLQGASESLGQPNDGRCSPLDLFSDRDPDTTMRFVADLLVPSAAYDDFGQHTTPTSSLMTYTVALRYHGDEDRLMLVEEELTHHNKGDARKVLLFPHSSTFRDSVVTAGRFGAAFLSTRVDDGKPVVHLHGDNGSRGRSVAASTSPRTVLAGTGTSDYPTVVAARREMASWHLVQLEPSALRTPDRFATTAPIDETGHHLAATLRRLGRERARARSMDSSLAMQQVCADACLQLTRLVDGVQDVRVHKDEVRQLHGLEVRFRGSDLWMAQHTLSAGTLRGLALVAMQMDTSTSRLLCIEEPENGIEPTGVPALVQLLRDYAVDANAPVDTTTNPLRQVVLNTHSREVVRQLQADEVLFVEAPQEDGRRGAQVRSVDFADVWRPDTDRVSRDLFKQWTGELPRGQTNLA